MKKTFLWAIIGITALSFLSFAAAAAGQEVTLGEEEAVAIALRDNRDLLLKEAEVSKAKLKIAEAHALLLPELTLTGSWSKTRGYYAKDFSSSSAQATLKEYIYRGGATVNTLKYNGYAFEIAKSVLDKTKLELALNVRKAFYTYLLAEELVRVNQGIVENTQEHLSLVKERFSCGEASETDLRALGESLSNVQAEYQSALSQRESARLLLFNLLNLDRDAKVRPAGEFIYKDAEIAYDEAFLSAMQKRPEIRQLDQQAEADRRSVELAKAGNRPSIYASWDYYSRSHAALGTSKNWNDYNVVGLTFSWPVFDGWETKAKVEQALVALSQTKLMKEKTVQDIALELKDAYLGLKDAIARIRSSQAQVTLQEDICAQIKYKYGKGIASALDVHDATLACEVARFGHKQTIYDYIVSKAAFEKATGGM